MIIALIDIFLREITIKMNPQEKNILSENRRPNEPVTVRWHYWLKQKFWLLPDAVALLFEYELEGTDNGQRLNTSRHHYPPQKPYFMSKEKYAEVLKTYRLAAIAIRRGDLDVPNKDQLPKIEIENKMEFIFKYHKTLIDKDKFLDWARKKNLSMPKILDDYSNGKLRQTDRSFPEGLRWNEISVRFLNNEEVLIKYRGETFSTGYAAMGFCNKRSKSFNKQWGMFIDFAKNNGILPTNKSYFLKECFDKTKQQKRKLSQTLQNYFGIKDDPFQKHHAVKNYCLKIKFLPERE